MPLTYEQQVQLIADVALTARVRQGMIDVALEVMASAPRADEPEAVRMERHRRRTRYAVEVLRAPETAAQNMMKALVTLEGASASVSDAVIKLGIGQLWDAFAEEVRE